MIEFWYFFLFALGLAILVRGSNWFVGSAVWAAEVFRIPAHIIGASIVSICTTLPETVVAAASSVKNEPSMALGSALGSIGVNMGLLLAVLILTSGPKISNRRDFFLHVGLLTLLLALLWAAVYYTGEITRPMALMLILLLLFYILNNVYSAAQQMDLDIQYDIVYDRRGFLHLDHHEAMPEGKVYDEKDNDFNISFHVLLKKIFFFCFGVLLVVLGSNLMVDNGIRIAEFFHMPHYVVSVVFISVGTSLPELATVITSVRKGFAGLGIGNIIGASILNILQVIGIAAILHPLQLSGDKGLFFFQLPLLILMVLLLTGFGLLRKAQLGKWCGILLLLLYVLSIFVNLFRESVPILGPLLF